MESGYSGDSGKNKFGTKKIMAILFIVIVVGIIAMLSLGVYQKNNKLKEKEIQNNELSKKMSSTNEFLNKQTARADSMNRILVRITKYMPFAASLQYRDSICSKLLHSSGDVVRMKPDSSVWVIVALSIKGGKWQHTVSYILRDSSRKQIEVEPEAIY